MKTAITILLFLACDFKTIEVKRIVEHTSEKRCSVKCSYCSTEKNIEHLVWAEDFNGQVKPYWITHYEIEKSTESNKPLDCLDCLSLQYEPCIQPDPTPTPDQDQEWLKTEASRRASLWKKAAKKAECKVACERE